jgi:ribosomal protein L11 methylase PrmA
MTSKSTTLPSSFRDPSGFIYTKNGELFRHINPVYQPHYQKLIDSGLYQALVEKELLIPHQELPVKSTLTHFKTVKPKKLDFISYPYEWSFSQLKDAAHTTLAIQQLAMKHGLTLKDASAYNIQFLSGKPILIDTLSFEIYDPAKPWVAYRQFCQHFLAPLALMAHTDVRLSQLPRVYIDGIPLDLASKLLPKSSYLNPGLLTHLHLHAKTQTKYANDTSTLKHTKLTMSQAAMAGLMDNLNSTINKLTWKYTPTDTEWGDYYHNTNYSDKAFNHKKSIISKWTKQIKPNTVWDLGANNGEFSRLAADQKINTLAFDIDPIAVEKNYIHTKQTKQTYMLPLLLDLTNPSPAIGWHNQERDALLTRGPADLVYALALMHHLTISNNVPFNHLAAFFHSVAKNLIIEFVPKTDSKVQKLLSSREDIFKNYDLDHFITAFSAHFTLKAKTAIQDSDRTLLLLTRK